MLKFRVTTKNEQHIVVLAVRVKELGFMAGDRLMSDSRFKNILNIEVKV